MAWVRDWPSRRALLAAYALSGLTAGLLSYLFGQSQNLEVFLQGARDLLTGADLYELHASEWYKYSPTFALLFIPFLWMPGWLAGALWSLLNFLSVFFGMDAVVKDDRQKRIGLTIALFGIVLVTDGDQSNLLIAGTILLAHRALEDGKPLRFALFASLGALVKIFPVLAVGFALFHKARLRHLAAFVAVTAVLCFAPLLVLPWDRFVFEYASWKRLLSQESAINRGWSLMGVLEKSLHRGDVKNLYVQAAGAAILGVPALRGLLRGTTATQRLALLEALMVFMVLFNHRTEYCTFVVPAAALGLWYARGPKTTARTLLLVLTLVAPGPIYTAVQANMTGFLAFLAAHRKFHWFRLAPLTVTWALMLYDLWRSFADAPTSGSPTLAPKPTPAAND